MSVSVTVNQMKLSAHCFIQWLLQDNFKSSDLLTVDQVPEIHREPFIYSGYRRVYKPWKYYIHSILHLHNETFNVWTHVIGFFIIFFRLVHVLKDYDIINDKPAWPILVFGLCCLATMILSSTAHLLHSKSPFHHYALFMLDYAAVATNGYGTAVGVMLIASHKRFRDPFQAWYLPANVFVGWFTFFLLCVANTKSSVNESRRKSLRLCSVLIQGLFIFLPMAPRYTECLSNPEFDLSSLNHINLVLLLDVLCAIFYGALLPERLMPGRCDIFGHSHQIFHALVVATMYMKFSSIEVDIELLQVSKEIFPSFSSIVLSLCMLIFVVLLTYIYFVQSVLHLPCKRKVKKKTL